MRSNTRSALALVSLLYAGVEAQQSGSAAAVTPPSNATVNAFGAIASSAAVVGNATSSAASAPATGIANPGKNPLIPLTISTSCQYFLELLNADPSIASCTQPLLSTLSEFTPSSSDSTYTASSSEIDSALSSLCTTAACSTGLLRSSLTAFEGNCTAELQAKNPTVLGLYEVLYITAPLLASVCSKDVNGGYCLPDITSGSVPAASAAATTLSATNASSSSSPSGAATNQTILVATNSSSVFGSKAYSIADYAGAVATSPQVLFNAVTSATRKLFRRQSGNAAVLDSSNSSSSASTTTQSTGVLPNAASWEENNVPFLFLSPNMTSTVLCTTCTKAVFANYIAFEASHPHAIGLSNSLLLGNQGKLWTGIGNVCGSGFLQSVAEQAGQTVLSGGSNLRVGITVALLALVGSTVALFA